MPLDYDAIVPIVKKVASDVTSKFPSYVQVGDTEGALYVWLLKNRNWIEELEEEAVKAKIYPLMRKAAYAHCDAEKATAEGYALEDVYRYSATKIRALLQDALDYEDWQSFGARGDGQPRATPQANTSGDRIVELIDVKAALKALSTDAYNTIVWHFKYSYTVDMLADELGINAEAAKKRLQRAVGAVQRELGRKSPDELPGAPVARRRVQSNSAARAALSNNYEGN